MSRGCKHSKCTVLTCARVGCDRKICVDCFDDKFGKATWNTRKDTPVCTKACFNKLSNVHVAKPRWHNDGKGGKAGTNTLLKILLDWLTVPGNYAKKWRGKDNGGKKKLDVAAEIAVIINASGVVEERDGRNVYAKIQHMEQLFWAAHDWANTETGAGLKEKDPSSFIEKLEKKCPFYFDLLPIMGDRSGGKPRATNEDNLSESEDLLISIEDAAAAREKAAAVVHTHVDSDDNSGIVMVDKTPQVSSRMSPQKRKAGSISSASGRKQIINVGVSHEANAAAVGLATARQRLAEAKLEQINRRASKENLDNKLQILKRCEDLVASHPSWTKESILDMFPEFSAVIDAVMNNN